MSIFYRTISALTLLAFVTAPALGADEPKDVAGIQAAHDRALIRDLMAYLAKNPQAVDAEQAYMKVFDKVIEHDWFAENEAIARKYLAEQPEGPVRSLAQIVGTMAHAQAGRYADALGSFNALMAGLGGSDQEEFASNFADTLADSAMAAGQTDVARKVYQGLLKKFGGESPNLAQKVKDDLAMLDRVGTRVPSVAVNDLAGAPLRLTDLRGKYVLVDFWATWCAPSLVEFPRMQTLHAKYRAKGFEVVGVSLDESKAALVDFLAARKLPWRQVHNGTAGGDLVEAFGVRTLPATFLVSPEGTIIRLGARGPALEKALDALIR